MDLTLSRSVTDMTDELKQTVRIVRQPKVITDDRGRRVWNQPIDAVELDLVSTMQLQTILDTDDNAKSKIEEAARNEPNRDAVLAHDVGNDSYEFVDADGKEEFSLVSTQMLFKILEKDNPAKAPASDAVSEDEVPSSPGGFDPYNSS